MIDGPSLKIPIANNSPKVATNLHPQQKLPKKDAVDSPTSKKF